VFDLDVVQQHHLQNLGEQIAADGSGLDLRAQLWAQPGEFRLL